jgi:hypothetical protein
MKNVRKKLLDRKNERKRMKMRMRKKVRERERERDTRREMVMVNPIALAKCGPENHSTAILFCTTVTRHHVKQ